MTISDLHTMVRSVLLVLLSAAALLIGCARTFLLSKDCNTYFFGSDDRTFIAMLCGSGDLQKVLAEAALPEQASVGLYRAQCIEPSREDLGRVYASLTGEQQEALKGAFRRQGYEINAHPAPNFRVYPYDTNPNFCPPNRY